MCVCHLYDQVFFENLSISCFFFFFPLQHHTQHTTSKKATVRGAAPSKLKSTLLRSFSSSVHRFTESLIERWHIKTFPSVFTPSPTTTHDNLINFFIGENLRHYLYVPHPAAHPSHVLHHNSETSIFSNSHRTISTVWIRTAKKRLYVTNFKLTRSSYPFPAQSMCETTPYRISSLNKHRSVAIDTRTQLTHTCDVLRVCTFEGTRTLTLRSERNQN